MRSSLLTNRTSSKAQINVEVAVGRLLVTVQDSGAGVRGDVHDDAKGTGLSRLRERLAVLYGRDARLDAERLPEGGFLASITMPHVTDA